MNAAAPAWNRAMAMSRPAKARALVEMGECSNMSAARAYLADMGE